MIISPETTVEKEQDADVLWDTVFTQLPNTVTLLFDTVIKWLNIQERRIVPHLVQASFYLHVHTWLILTLQSGKSTKRKWNDIQTLNHVVYVHCTARLANCFSMP